MKPIAGSGGHVCRVAMARRNCDYTGQKRLRHPSSSRSAFPQRRPLGVEVDITHHPALSIPAPCSIAHPSRGSLLADTWTRRHVLGGFVPSKGVRLDSRWTINVLLRRSIFVQSDVSGARFDLLLRIAHFTGEPTGDAPQLMHLINA
jgi:hypothetical protein